MWYFINEWEHKYNTQSCGTVLKMNIWYWYCPQESCWFNMKGYYLSFVQIWKEKQKNLFIKFLPHTKCFCYFNILWCIYDLLSRSIKTSSVFYLAFITFGNLHTLKVYKEWMECKKICRKLEDLPKRATHFVVSKLWDRNSSSVKPSCETKFSLFSWKACIDENG